VSLRTWLSFLLASAFISLSPGPGALSSMSTGLRFGYRTAVFNVLGLLAGVLTLVSIVAVGLGAVLAASKVAFTATKWTGAAYLVYLGLQQWRKTGGPLRAEVETSTGGPRVLFLRGYLVNVTNPKGIIFLVAVLPQFIDPTQPTPLQYATCGATLMLTDFVVMSGYTALAGRLVRWLDKAEHVRTMNRLFGSLFVAAGLGLAALHRG
jgi:homoserine/homoserine lactone efflux protein